MRAAKCSALVVALLAAAGCTGDWNASEAADPSTASASDPVERADPIERTGPVERRTPTTGRTGQTAGADRRCERRPTHAPVPSAAEQERLDRNLLAATWGRDVARVHSLVRRGADVNAKDDTQQSAYLVTTSEGHERLLDFVLCHGADVESLDSFEGTGLIRAAERGHALVVGRLLRTAVEVDHVNNLGWTALLEAVVLGDPTSRYVDTVRALVAGGADVSIAAEGDGLTALEHARLLGRIEIAATLSRTLAADHRPTPDRATANQRLLRAARSGDADSAALALRHGARLEVRDGRGRTPLLRAALRDHLDVARLLVALGADPDARDDRQDTPWLVTGVAGSVGMLEALLPAEPDLSLRNRFGGVSLIPASERGHVAYVRRVLRTDIAVDHVNDLGWTALLEAVILGDGSRRYQQVVGALLGAGADPDLADAGGLTPLEHAQSRGQGAVVRLLTRAGPQARR